MATPYSLLLLLIAAAAVLISPARSLTCTSQTFPNHDENASYANCLDLPTLKAYLHWTYDPSSRPNPTLSIAFTATPAQPDGWVAWALNPTGSGMLGAQSLIAFKDANGSAVVKTYNISSYGPIRESDISYGVVSKSAVFAGGSTTIFAVLEVTAAEAAAELSQVWLVGAAVNNGVPAKHAFSPDNLNSKDTLRLVTVAPVAAPARVAGGQRGRVAGGGARVWAGGVGLYGVLVLLGVFVCFF